MKIFGLEISVKAAERPAPSWESQWANMKLGSGGIGELGAALWKGRRTSLLDRLRSLFGKREVYSCFGGARASAIQREASETVMCHDLPPFDVTFPGQTPLEELPECQRPAMAEPAENPWFLEEIKAISELSALVQANTPKELVFTAVFQDNTVHECRLPRNVTHLGIGRSEVRLEYSLGDGYFKDSVCVYAFFAVGQEPYDFESVVKDLSRQAEEQVSQKAASGRVSFVDGCLSPRQATDPIYARWTA